MQFILRNEPRFGHFAETRFDDSENPQSPCDYIDCRSMFRIGYRTSYPKDAAATKTIRMARFHEAHESLADMLKTAKARLPHCHALGTDSSHVIS